MGNLVLILLLFISRVLFLSPLAIYFDSPEYVLLIQNPSLIKALTLGHEPIHPGFILPAWLLNKILPIGALYSAELVSSLFSALGLFVFYKTTKLYFYKQIAAKALIIASLLPVLFLAGVNALTDTTYIFFYLLSFYCVSRFVFNKNHHTDTKWIFFGILSLGYSVLTHTQVILWLPLFFSPLLFIKHERKRYTKLITIFVIEGVGLGIFSLVVVMVSAGGNVFESLKLLFMHGGDVISSQNPLIAALRMLRNLAITLLRNNTSLVVLFAVFSFIKLWKKKRRVALFCLIWLLPVLVTAQYWHIGLFGRVSLLASFPIAIMCAHYKSKLVFFILFVNLLIITIPIALSNRQAPIQTQLQSLYKSIPSDSILVSSNLIRPQVTFRGETYFINEPGQSLVFISNKINTALIDGRPVYIDSQALFNPYYAYDGNHLHILSLSTYGNATIAPLFKEFEVKVIRVEDRRNHIYLYQVGKNNGFLDKTQKRTSPGGFVFYYSDKWQDRISHLRIDYRDIGTWAWVFISGRHEPTSWRIADKSGVVETP